MYEESLRQEEDDTCRALCRIFTETGEQYLHLILRDPQQALPVVSAVLRGSAHPDREVAEITFNFWYILSEELAGGGRMLEPVDTAAAFASGSATRPPCHSQGPARFPSS